ncbi:MAG TPA: response regulator [Allosphingosinicella sp.]|jgi:DNA-binding NtrC family response regulator
MSAREEEQHSPGGGLNGARILIVEDEYYLAEDLAGALKAAGAQVVGPVGSLRQAEAPLGAGGLDGALIDMNLRGESAFGLAERLQDAGIPFVIVSGYSREALPPSLAEVPRLEKPVDSALAVAALHRLLSARVG